MPSDGGPVCLGLCGWQGPSVTKIWPSGKSGPPLTLEELKRISSAAGAETGEGVGGVRSVPRGRAVDGGGAADGLGERGDPGSCFVALREDCGNRVPGRERRCALPHGLCSADLQVGRFIVFQSPTVQYHALSANRSAPPRRSERHPSSSEEGSSRASSPPDSGGVVDPLSFIGFHGADPDLRGQRYV